MVGLCAGWFLNNFVTSITDSDLIEFQPAPRFGDESKKDGKVFLINRKFIRGIYPDGDRTIIWMHGHHGKSGEYSWGRWGEYRVWGTYEEVKFKTR